MSASSIPLSDSAKMPLLFPLFSLSCDANLRSVTDSNRFLRAEEGRPQLFETHNTRTMTGSRDFLDFFAGKNSRKLNFNADPQFCLTTIQTIK